MDLASPFLLQATRQPFDLNNAVHPTGGQSHGPTLIGQGLQDGLANPPNSIGNELKAFGFIVAVNRLEQAQIALVNQVVET